jgi:DNA (cytosine-5)-methyltransferase 1
MLRVLDLFSGIGGFSLGLERTGGFKTVAFCEIEPFPRRVLAKHWPEVPCYHDVRELTADQLAADGIGIDVICGGFPCQDISFAGKGAGLAGERSGLWSEYARLIGELQPRYAIVENVSALLSRGLADVLGDLAALGYDAEWHCIPASAVGAPHRRDRIWIIAHANGSEWRKDIASRRSVQWKNGLPQGQEGSGRFSSNSQAVADTDGQRELQSQGSEHNEWGRAGNGGESVADATHNGIGWRQQQPEGSEGKRYVADASSSGLSNSLAWRLRQELSMPACNGWWRAEPNVGRSFDGVSKWLERCVGRGLSYAESCRRTEVLRSLWSIHVSQALRKCAGGLDRFQQAQILFAFVREYESGSDEARLLVAGQEAPEDFLRSLRDYAITGSASRRSGQDKQRDSEHPDAVQHLSRLLALDGKADWAGSGWEDATPRIAVNVPSRVDRLKGLGNAVVPQIPELIGRAILAAGT